MDKDELKKLDETLAEKIYKESGSNDTPEIKKPNNTTTGILNYVEQYQQQRIRQRQELFTFLQWISWSSFGLIVYLVTVQSVMRVFCDRNFEIFNKNEFEIISIAVFGEIIGVLIIIARSLYNSNHELK